MESNYTIDENTRIIDIESLPNRIKDKFSLYFDIVKEITGEQIENKITQKSEKSVSDLLNLDGVTIKDVSALIIILNAHDFHLTGEEKINFKGLFNEPTKALYEECDELIKKRDEVRHRNKMAKELKEKLNYANEAMDLTSKIEEKFFEIQAKLSQIEDNCLGNKQIR